jgi:hypothetical protein
MALDAECQTIRLVEQPCYLLGLPRIERGHGIPGNDGVPLIAIVTRYLPPDTSAVAVMGQSNRRKNVVIRAGSRQKSYRMRSDDQLIRSVDVIDLSVNQRSTSTL